MGHPFQVRMPVYHQSPNSEQVESFSVSINDSDTVTDSDSDSDSDSECQ